MIILADFRNTQNIVANAMEGVAPCPCNQHMQSPTILLQEQTRELCQTDFHGLMPKFSSGRGYKASLGLLKSHASKQVNPGDLCAILWQLCLTQGLQSLLLLTCCSLLMWLVASVFSSTGPVFSVERHHEGGTYCQWLYCLSNH